jgi:hypothetical protein
MYINASANDRNNLKCNNLSKHHYKHRELRFWKRKKVWSFLFNVKFQGWAPAHSSAQQDTPRVSLQMDCTTLTHDWQLGRFRRRDAQLSPISILKPKSTLGNGRGFESREHMKRVHKSCNRIFAQFHRKSCTHVSWLKTSKIQNEPKKLRTSVPENWMMNKKYFLKIFSKHCNAVIVFVLN